MFTVDDGWEWVAVTAETHDGVSTCCAAEVAYDPDKHLDVCVECGSAVVAIVK